MLLLTKHTFCIGNMKRFDCLSNYDKITKADIYTLYLSNVVGIVGLQ